jgi:hypothetical protein
MSPVFLFRAEGTKVPAGRGRAGGFILSKTDPGGQIRGKMPIFKQEKAQKSRLSAHLFTFAYYLYNPYRISLKKWPVR